LRNGSYFIRSRCYVEGEFTENLDFILEINYDQLSRVDLTRAPVEPPGKSIEPSPKENPNVKIVPVRPVPLPGSREEQEQREKEACPPVNPPIEKDWKR
jgi:hypothetical protein